MTLKLYKGNISVDGAGVPTASTTPRWPAWRAGSYNQDDAEGFLRIMGLPSRVRDRCPREY
ncbi:MAG: hypothetical protein Ct9H300mP1_01110 [Planctomycetaceae bacterium]|nr:MAG: hypothetical protein Ct9H300mP1_01110 [Planctomycetaceae bacterium]